MDTLSVEYFAPCPKGFELLLADELKRLQARRVRPLKSGAAFFGSKADGYRICLWSRIASRVLRVVDRVDARDAQALYEGVRAIEWERFIAPGATMAVTARGTNGALRNTQFAALKVKDAVCDRLRGVRGERPDIKTHRPDVSLWVSIHGGKATVSIDYAGESLYRRGYRTSAELAEPPLKESLAAGMLVWGGWDASAAPALRRAEAERAGREGVSDAPAFIDPVCGSGTLVLEAAMMAADRAPGLSRDYWGFSGCADFDEDSFDALLDDADERFEAGLENMPICIGADIDARAIAIAQDNARRLGMAGHVTFVCADCAQMPHTITSCGASLGQRGHVALDPPRGAGDGLDRFYESLAQGLHALSAAWRMNVITSDEGFDSAIGYDAQRTLAAYNGASEATIRDYRLGESFMVEMPLVSLDGIETSVSVSSDHALQFAARLRKMAKARRKWARKNDIHAYRIYDADLPDYAVAVDVFEEMGTGERHVLVTEYQAPSEIDPQKAHRRFKDACTVTAALLGVAHDALFTRVRRQDRGGSQYRKDVRDSHTILVEEAGHPFEVDLSGYLDTGLFLDHRITRALVGEYAQGKRFLNLFAYTASASVYAAAGGAVSTTTVDMSQTYLDWARRNMGRSGFSSGIHRFVRADVLAWVEKAAQANERYDVVFLDPPTFSNSKAMGKRTWDIQRDHEALIRSIKGLLAPSGTIIFSGNLRSFKLDGEALDAMGFIAENITAETIPEDFARNPKIHFCYILRLKD